MSSSQDDLECASPEIRDAAEGAANTLPSSKSMQIYEAAYQNFLTWRKARQAITSENSLVLYFEEIGNKYKPTSLWSQYSMLKKLINLKEKIDIGKFPALLALLKNKSRGFQSKKANIFSSENVQQFLSEAPDNIYLAIKVLLIFGVTGACRGDELTNLKVQNIEKHGELFLVKILDTKNKKPRSFTISGKYAEIVKQYQALRPKNVTCDRFFLNYQKGKCTNQVIGKNKISSMPKQIATFLKLENPDTYTGHAFRRTSATLLADPGDNILDLQRHGGWASSKVAEGYIEESMSDTIKIENMTFSDCEIKLPTTGSIEESAGRCESPPPKRTKHEENLPATNTNKESVQICESPSPKRTKDNETLMSEEKANSPRKIFNFENCNVTINYNTIPNIE